MSFNPPASRNKISNSQKDAKTVYALCEECTVGLHNGPNCFKAFRTKANKYTYILDNLIRSHFFNYHGLQISRFQVPKQILPKPRFHEN